MAAMMSVERSMTIMAAVPNPDPSLPSASKSMVTSAHCSAVMQRTDEPPGMTASRLSQPPRTPPQCRSMSSRIGIPISSSTVQGLFTCPEIWNSLVPVLLGLPRLANHAGPRRRMSGTTAIDSTLLMVVGAP